MADLITYLNTKMIGKKAESLSKLKASGFNVPPFLTIDNSEVVGLFNGKKITEAAVGKLAEKIKRELICEKYVIRSSGLIEDSREESFAGQFKTVIDKTADELEDAIKEVVTHAHEYLDGDIGKFSIIAQEYIAADFSGVAFSRSPLGGREMVIEYHRGIGEELVGGTIRPDKVRFYWNEAEVKHQDLPLFQDLVAGIKKIETEFEFPQDIEWCIKGGEIYYLQARPITTLTDQQYLCHKFLDDFLPESGDFLFEETEISEIAQRPCNFTFSLLQNLYMQYGPVDKVYQKHGIKYEYRDFLKIIGNELYVDRDEELKTLLPAYSYFGRKHFAPHLARFGGMLRSWKNIWKLNHLPLSKYEELRAKLRDALRSELPENDSFKKRLEHFLYEYELIFEINILASKAFKRLEFALRNQPISVAEILSCSFDTDYEEVIYFDDKGLTGNGLNIADEEDFICTNMTSPISEAVNAWHDSLSNLEKKLFMPQILQGQRFNRLREYGRWLTVKNINYLRAALPQKDHIYFATIEEVVLNRVDENECTERKKIYEDNMQYNFPSRIVSRPEGVETKLQGVSSGTGRGKLLTLADLKSRSGKKDGVILYTQVLSPDLFKHFDMVDGILAEQGGMLSHLAIIAREKKMPVLVGFDFVNSKIQIGDNVMIDANKNEVWKI